MTGTAHPVSRNPERDAAFVAMVESGMTCADIGALVGLSRQAVSMLVGRSDLTRGVYAESGVGYSLTAIMAMVRDSRVTTFKALCVGTGHTPGKLKGLLSALGRWEAVTRLLRLRRRRDRRAAAIAAVRRYLSEYGEVPTSCSVSHSACRRGRPIALSWPVIHDCFGSWGNLMRACGLPYRRSRRRKPRSAP